MTTDVQVKLTIAFIDPDFDVEEREEQAQLLLESLRENRDVATVGRVPDPAPPMGHKSGGSFLTGRLTAAVNKANLKKVLGFLGRSLERKPIELEVEVSGRTPKKLKVKAYSAKELEAAIAAAQEFVEQ